MAKSSDEFITPPDLVKLAKAVLNGPIDFDPFSSPGQLIPARDGLTLASDPEPWPASGNWWANIPFSESKTVLPRLAQHFGRCPDITALVLCLAAPGALYWERSVWSPTIGARRVAWLPRISFYQLDASGKAVPTAATISREISLMVWTQDDRILTRFERLVSAFAPSAKDGKPSKREARRVHISEGGRP